METSSTTAQYKRNDRLIQLVVRDRMNSICPMNCFRTTDTTDTTDTTIWKPGFTHMYIGRTTTLSTFIRYLSLIVSHTRARGATTPQQAFVINGTCEEMQQRFSEILANYAI